VGINKVTNELAVGINAASIIIFLFARTYYPIISYMFCLRQFVESNFKFLKLCHLRFFLVKIIPYIIRVSMVYFCIMFQKSISKRSLFRLLPSFRMLIMDFLFCCFTYCKGKCFNRHSIIFQVLLCYWILFLDPLLTF
jgi:hypothetical protein